jgi:hypothetical protein
MREQSIDVRTLNGNRRGPQIELQARKRFPYPIVPAKAGIQAFF